MHGSVKFICKSGADKLLYGSLLLQRLLNIVSSDFRAKSVNGKSLERFLL
jgi:hypothetical protein